MRRDAAKYCPYVRLKSEGDLRRRVRDWGESSGKALNPICPIRNEACSETLLAYEILVYLSPNSFTNLFSHVSILVYTLRELAFGRDTDNPTCGRYPEARIHMSVRCRS
jgi:hypothetical protein